MTNGIIYRRDGVVDLVDAADPAGPSLIARALANVLPRFFVLMIVPAIDDDEVPLGSYGGSAYLY